MDQEKSYRTVSIVTWSCATLTVLLFFIWYFGFVDDQYRDAPVIAQIAIAAVGAFSGYMLYRSTMEMPEAEDERLETRGIE